MATNYSPTIVTDGAVFVGDALMPSTATSATTLYDRVGGNNGTMYNGSCADFDGTDDYIDCGAPSSMDSLSAFSISLWFKLDSLAVLTATWLAKEFIAPLMHSRCRRGHPNPAQIKPTMLG